MDALGLLLEASAHQEAMQLSGEAAVPRDKHEYGDALDAIMLLAGQASMLRVPSPMYRSHSAYETVHGLLPDIPPLTPSRSSARHVEIASAEDTRARGVQARRPRALSEPWSMAEFAQMHASSG
eukprot:gene44385-54277_t